MNVVLNGHSFGINIGSPSVSNIGPTLFLIFINNLPFDCNYADDIPIYSCLNGKFDRFDKVRFAADLKNDLQSVVIWGKIWFVNFNAFKTKLLSFDHVRESCAFHQH